MNDKDKDNQSGQEVNVDEYVKELREPQYIVGLTKQELDVLLTLLAPSNDEPDYTPLEQKLTKASVEMDFVNVYRFDQQYGGPEEGGWYYYTCDCVESRGFLKTPGSTIQAVGYALMQFTDYYDTFSTTGVLDAIKNDLLHMPSIDDLIKQLERTHHAHLPSITDINDKYTWFEIRIEPVPALSQHTQREHYE